MVELKAGWAVAGDAVIHQPINTTAPEKLERNCRTVLSSCRKVYGSCLARSDWELGQALSVWVIDLEVSVPQGRVPPVCRGAPPGKRHSLSSPPAKTQRPCLPGAAPARHH